MEHPLSVEAWVASQSYDGQFAPYWKKQLDALYSGDAPLTEFSLARDLKAENELWAAIEEACYQMYLKSKASGSECPTNAT
jgi:hypothetical protein